MIIESMPQKDFESYFNAISLLSAEEKLDQIGNSSFPHYKKETQQKIRRQLNQVLRRGIKKESSKLITPEELAGKALRSGKNG